MVWSWLCVRSFIGCGCGGVFGAGGASRLLHWMETEKNLEMGGKMSEETQNISAKIALLELARRNPETLSENKNLRLSFIENIILLILNGSQWKVMGS